MIRGLLLQKSKYNNSSKLPRFVSIRPPWRLGADQASAVPDPGQRAARSPSGQADALGSGLGDQGQASRQEQGEPAREAQAARQQDIQNRFNLGQATQGLGQFQSGLAGQQAALGQAQEGVLGTNISRLGSLGALNQAQTQAGFDATREANRAAAFQPQEQLQNYGNLVTGIMGGMQGSGTATTNVPNPTPLQTALGVGTTLAGIYGGLKNPGKVNFNMNAG